MLYKLLGAMDEERYDQAVVVLMDHAVYGPKIEALGVPVHALEMRQGKPSFEAVRKLRAIVREFAPDLVQGWMYHGNLAALLARATLKTKPIVCWNIRQTLYDIDKEKRLTKAVIKFGSWLSRKPDTIIYNSRVSATQHEEQGYCDAVRKIIPNGFDADVFRFDAEARTRVRAELGIGDSDIVIGNVARYHPMKDHRGLIEAAATVKRSLPQARFVFVGDGVDATQAPLVDEIGARGLTDSILLLGERLDIPKVLSAFDAFTLTSAWGEGFPNAIGEAMACELPCVVTDIGDSAAIVDRFGTVVPPGDPDALAAALLAVLAETPERRREIGRGARERIRSVYSLAAVTADYEALYDGLLGFAPRSAA